LLAIRRDGDLAGVAPLMKLDRRLSLLGSSDVCDYLDFVVPLVEAPPVCHSVLQWVESKSWDRFDLFSMATSSVLRRNFLPLAASNGLAVQEEPEDVCPAMDLPASWDDYLAGLNRTDRHELRRKMRRLASEPDVEHEIVSDSTSVGRDMNDFFRLFLDSRADKTNFLTSVMKDFFTEMAQSMASNGWFNLFFLKMSGVRVAAAIIFDCGDTFYLYNSGYDKNYAQLGVGLLLNAQCIRTGIERGKRRFDFLRGNEPYKYHFGGHDELVYRCRISKG
jgi:CelD/BcsL family acetyltransferase involved in cellulose biosynthesis